MDHPMSINGYAWVEGNPVMNVDPSGASIDIPNVDPAVSMCYNDCSTDPCSYGWGGVGGCSSVSEFTRNPAFHNCMSTCVAQRNGRPLPNRSRSEQGSNRNLLNGFLVIVGRVSREAAVSAGISTADGPLPFADIYALYRLCATGLEILRQTHTISQSYDQSEDRAGDDTSPQPTTRTCSRSTELRLNERMHKVCGRKSGNCKNENLTCIELARTFRRKNEANWELTR